MGASQAALPFLVILTSRPPLLPIPSPAVLSSLPPLSNLCSLSALCLLAHVHGGIFLHQVWSAAFWAIALCLAHCVLCTIAEHEIPQ